MSLSPTKTQTEYEKGRITITQQTYFYGVDFLDRRKLALNINKPEPITYLKAIQSNDKGEVVNFITQVNEGKTCVGTAVCENGEAKCIFIESIISMDVYNTENLLALSSIKPIRTYNNEIPQTQEKMQTPKTPQTQVRPIFIILLIGAIIFALVYYKALNPTSPNTPTQQYQPNITMPDLFSDTNTIQFPENGTTYINPDLECVAPFNITTPNDKNKYYIKLKSTENNDKDVIIYMDASKTVEIAVPLGDYEFYYAVGAKWYGESELFGMNTQYFKSDDILTFYNDEENNVYNGHIISLISTIDGNLQTKPISKSRFNN